MDKVIFKLASLVLCSVVAISAQQVDEPQPQPQVQQPQPQVQQPLPQVQQPQPQVQQPQPQVQQPQVQQPQLQQQMRQPQTDCPKSITQPKYGLWAKFNMNDVSYGFNSKKNKDIDMGIGFGFGVVRRTPIIANTLDINPEIGLLHRNLYSEKFKASDGKDSLVDESEFILSIIPVLAQFTPFEFPLYVEAGFQLDFPISAKYTITHNDDEINENFTKRAWYDLGIVYGLGYNITDRFSFNFRSVIGLRSITGKRSDARTPTQYGIGVVFF